jgi:predicted AAA+ superfamily ATPase
MTNLQAVLAQRLTDALSTPFPSLTRRDIRLPSVAKKATAVIGVRRSGKTSLLYSRLADQLNAGRPRDSLVLLGLDDDRLAGLAATDLAWLVDEYFRRLPAYRGRTQVTLCLDEIQVVPGWERVVRRLIDTERMQIMLSGSSAKLLSREIATSLRGRAMEALVHPFSFREVLRHAGEEPATPWGSLTTAQRSTLDNRLRTYLSHGGFPEAQAIDARDRVNLLQGYVDTMLLRDVIDRHAVTNPFALRWLQRELLANPAALFSVNKFFNTLRSQGVAVGKDTLHAYLSHLEDAFLVRTVALHTRSERRRMVNPRKAYPIDPGLIPLFQRTTETQTGHAFETVVMLELERRGYRVEYVLTKDAHEVDFYATAPERVPLLVQACADTSTPRALEREVRALSTAKVSLRGARALLLTLTADAPPELPAGIEWMPAAEWLLSDDA